jgi:transcription elongation factor S-II
MSLNAVRRQSTDEVTSLAKSLTKSWKKLLDGPSTHKDPAEKEKEHKRPLKIALKQEKKEKKVFPVESRRKDETNARDT